MRYIILFIGFLLPAVAHAQVVLTEVRWAGSQLSTADEWFRIQNVSQHSVDLTGWQVTTRKSDGSHEPMLTFMSRSLAPNETLLISNYAPAKSVLTEEPDVVTSAVSLPNSKLLLRVLNADGAVVDQADDGVGAPFAGGKDPYVSMVRIDKHVSGTVSENWRDEGEESEASSTSSSSLQSSPSSPSSSSSQSSQSSTAGITVGSTQPQPADNAHVRISAIIPKPPSGKRGDQQIVLEYSGGKNATLDGWQLDNRRGGSTPVSLSGIGFEANGSRMFTASWLGVSFTPERDTARLIAPDGTVVSMLAWQNPAPWQTVRPIREAKRRMPVAVVRADGADIQVRLTPDSFVGLLPGVERHWARVAHTRLHPFIAVQLTGISLKRGAKLPLEPGQTVYLDPQRVDWNPVPTVHAYVYLADGTLLQHNLLSRNNAVAVADTHPRRVEFAALNQPSSHSSSSSHSSPSSIEQKMYTNSSEGLSSQNPVELLPVRYKNIVPAAVEDPRVSSSSAGIDSQVLSLMEANVERSKSSKKGAEAGLPWVLLFSQSALWLITAGKKWI